MSPAPVAMRNMVTKPTRVLAESSYAAPKLSNRTSNKILIINYLNYINFKHLRTIKVFFLKKNIKIQKCFLAAPGPAWRCPRLGRKTKWCDPKTRAQCGPANLAEMDPARSGFG